MKRFILKLSFFLGAIIVCIFAAVAIKYVFVGSQYENNYMASFYDKIERLQSIDEPKIILVGNSNLAFGVDSEKLEAAMGMPVVNLGLHGSVGNSFLENMAKYNIGQGDIVVVCHTNYHSNVPSDRLLVWTTIDNHPEALKALSADVFFEILPVYGTYYKRALKQSLSHREQPDESGSYCRKAFNGYGDVVIKPESKRLDERELFQDDKRTKSSLTLSEENKQRLNEYNKYIMDHGASMVIVSFPIACSEYSNLSQSDYTGLQKELERSLDCDVISDFTDYMFPCEYFYDTVFHLTEEGTEKRTELLISDLKNWMAEGQK